MSYFYFFHITQPLLPYSYLVFAVSTSENRSRNQTQEKCNIFRAKLNLKTMQTQTLISFNL